MPEKKPKQNIIDDPNREYVVGLIKAIGGVEKTLSNLENSPTVAIMKALQEKLENGNDVASFMWSLLRGPRGEKGDSIKGDPGPQGIPGKQGIPGEPGKSLDEGEILRKLLKSIPEPIPGPRGLPGEKGKDAVVDYAKIIDAVIEKLPKNKNAKKELLKISIKDIEDFPEIGQLVRKYVYDFSESRVGATIVAPGASSLLTLADVNPKDLAIGYVPTWNGTQFVFQPRDSASAGGSNTQVLFNDGGVANGSSKFVFDKATGALTLNGKLALAGGGGFEFTALPTYGKIQTYSSLPLWLNQEGNNVILGNSGSQVSLGASSWTTGKKLTIQEGTMVNNQNGGIDLTGNIVGFVGSNGISFTLNNTTANQTGYVRLDRTASSVFVGMTINSQSRDGIRFMTHATSPVEVGRISDAGKVGWGTGSSFGDTLFHINSGLQEHQLTLSGTDNAVGETAGLEFRYSNGTGNTKIARILGYTQSGGGGDLLFQTAPGGGSAYTTKMTLSRTGDLLLNADSCRLYLGATNLNYAVINRGQVFTGNSTDLYIGETADTGRLIMRGSGETTIQSKVGVGLTGATAKLHLAAGTATANSGPLKFTSGVVTTTPEAGLVEFVNAEDGLTFTAVSTRRKFVLDTATQTLSGKRITNRVQTVASSATVTPSWDNDDVVTITAQAVGLTLANPTGTPTAFQPIKIRVKDNGTARTIAYGAGYRAIGVTLPTTTVISKTLYLGGFWNEADSKLDITSVAQEA